MLASMSALPATPSILWNGYHRPLSTATDSAHGVIARTSGELRYQLC